MPGSTQWGWATQGVACNGTSVGASLPGALRELMPSLQELFRWQGRPFCSGL